MFVYVLHLCNYLYASYNLRKCIYGRQLRAAQELAGALAVERGARLVHNNNNNNNNNNDDNNDNNHESTTTTTNNNNNNK